MLKQPTGTITFLFTDIEGSTTRWEHFPESMPTVIARHDELLNTIMQEHGGYVFKTVGDAFYVAFETAGEALAAAIEGQQALAAEVWPQQIAPLRVRMALHTGEAESRDNDYFGQTLNKVARILSTGHGGQILLSQATMSLLQGHALSRLSVQDLGEHRLKDMQLPEHIFQICITDLPGNFPPLKTLDHHPNNLPTQMTPFIGREHDLSALHALLMQPHVRLITLIGPGGTGKTRLSLQVAANLADAFTDGVYFVELETVREMAGIAPAIARALHIRDAGGHSPLELLKEVLKGRVLLVLDNFEQVVTSAPLLLELLMNCQHLKMLVTSRAALHISGEHEYYVAPLIIPPLKRPFNLSALAQFEAIELFLQRARATRPDFQLTAANAAAVITICQELDGLPLAIELAAALVNILPPQALSKRIGQRLKLLTRGERGRSERQQTLRHAIAWSYEMLTEDEKLLLAQLSIFSEGCTLEAIEAICTFSEDTDADLIDTLYSLLNKSLLRQHEQENGEPRFLLLHTIREYALEQLHARGTIPALLQRHAHYYLDLAEQGHQALIGPEQKQGQTRLELEQENLLAALRWCITQQQTSTGLRLVASLWQFWLMHGHLQHYYALLEQLLSAENIDGVAPAIRARALEGASRLALALNKSERAAAFSRAMLQFGQLIADQEIISSASIILADSAMRQGDLRQAVTLLEQSLQIRQAMGDIRGMASLLTYLGNLALGEGQLERAALLQEQSLTLLREVGDEHAIAHVLTHLGKVALLREDYQQAIILYEESLQRCRDLGDTRGMATALFHLGMVAFCQDDLPLVAHHYQASLELFRDLDDQPGIAICLERIAELASARHQSASATRLLACARTMFPASDEVALYYQPDRRDATLDVLRLALGDALFQTTWRGGSDLSLDQAIAEALEVTAEQ